MICKGRKIGIQIDLTVDVNIETIMGKTFEVEIGRIGSKSVSNVFDRNGNGLDPLTGNIKFEKTLAFLHLDDASTSFPFAFDHGGN